MRKVFLTPILVTFLNFLCTERMEASHPSSSLPLETGKEKESIAVRPSLPLVPQNEKSADLKVGLKLWPQQRDFYVNQFTKIPAKNNLSVYLPSFFSSSPGEMKDYFLSGKRIKIEGIYKIRDKLVDILFYGGEHGLLTFHLFTSLAKTHIELAGELINSFKKAKYLRKDFFSLREQVKEALLVTSYVEHFFRKYHGFVDTPFSQEEFVKELDSIRYIPSDKLKSDLDRVCEIALLNGNEIDAFGYLYSTNKYFVFYLNNAYYNLTKYLESRDRALDRKLKSALPDYIPPVKLEDYENSIRRLLSDEEKPQKKKRRRPRIKRKKTQQLAAISAEEPVESGQVLSGEVRSLAEEKTEETVNQDPPLTVNQDPPLIEEKTKFIGGDFQEGEKEQQIETMNMGISEAVFEKTKGFEEQKIELKDVPEKLSDFKRTAKKGNKESKNETNLARLSKDYEKATEVLSEYEREIKGGMKSRDFIGMMTALEKLGYFKKLQANKKQVQVTLPKSEDYPEGYNALFHLNHSNRKKDKGITNTTAQKGKEMLGALKGVIDASKNIDEEKKDKKKEK